MNALILAAGLGKRMRPLTNEMPKAMVLLKGKPLIEHVLIALSEAGIEEALIVVGHLKEKIIGYFGKEFEGMKLQYVEQKEMNGTAKAILLGEKFFKQDFIVCSADVIAEQKLFEELKSQKSGQKDAVIVVRKSETPEKYGVVEVDFGKNLVLGLEEKPEKPKSNLVNAGIYKFSPKVFGFIKKTEKNPKRREYEITDTIKLMLKEKRKIGFLVYGGKCLDIGSLEELENANAD